MTTSLMFDRRWPDLLRLWRQAAKAGAVAACLLAANLAQAATGPQVHWLIDMRAEIAAGRFQPERDQIGVRGATPPLSWERSALAHAGPQPGWYDLSLSFDAPGPNAQAVPYKFKIEQPGRADGGWENGPNRSLVLPTGGQSLTVQRAFGEQTAAPPPQRVGQIERLAPAPSAWVGPREVQVWLPPGYDANSAQHYPVLYLHDGQNLFDAQAAGAEWQVDETAQALVSAGQVRPMIIVGVASTGDRILDYTPWVAAEQAAGPRGGGAARYARYLVDELKPLIDRRYRTLPDRAHTAVGGSSLGGLVSMWLVLHEPTTFGAALVVSPSVWWADRALLKDVATTPWPADLPAPPLWLDLGAREGEGMVDGARALRQALHAKGWAPHYLEQADGGHDEASWAARFGPMLRYLYGPPQR
jgi:predicted alpha/beta superfamily hydrolase